MSELTVPAGQGDNTEYKIRRAPDLQVVTPGAQVRYACEWIAPGALPTVASENYWGPRDGIRWFSYSDAPPKGFFQKQIKVGPLAAAWDRAWDEDPGHYTVVAEIRSRLSDPGSGPTYCYRSQQVGAVGAMLNDWLQKLVGKGNGPSPDDAEREIRRYRALLADIAKKFPPANPAAAQRHKETVDRWDELAGRLRGLLGPTDGKKRISVRGIHLETATQAQRPLLLFLADLGDVQVPRGKAGMATRKRWCLVDWTDASDPRFRGAYQGEGDTTKEAIESCLSSWDWDNRYPEGHLTFEVPPELRATLGGPARRQLDTNGKNLTDEVIIAFQWIAIGGLLIAGFCFIFVAIPALTSAAMASSMLASTAGAVFSVGQRWRDGIFDWKADAIDGLTVVGNLVGAGVWARGARVRLLGSAGKKLDFVFLGARVGTDAAQGILIIEARLDDLERLMTDPTYPPEERARKMLALFAELTAVGLMTAMSFRASAKEAEHLNAKPRHLKDDVRANVPEDRLNDLTKPDELIDTTAPSIAEGNTKEIQHKTVVNTGISPAVRSKRIGATKTEFAKLYSEDGHPWRRHLINKNEIHLVDKDGFIFHAVCLRGSLELTIATVFDPSATPELSVFFPGVIARKVSTVLMAKELYPRMYEYFEHVGNPVKKLDGAWAWTNYRDAKIKYDELLAQGMTESEAARVAVTYARSYVKYDLDRGFTRVISATHVPEHRLFKFVIERE